MGEFRGIGVEFQETLEKSMTFQVHSCEGEVGVAAAEVRGGRGVGGVGGGEGSLVRPSRGHHAVSEKGDDCRCGLESHRPLSSQQDNPRERPRAPSPANGPAAVTQTNIATSALARRRSRDRRYTSLSCANPWCLRSDLRIRTSRKTRAIVEFNGL